MTQTAIRILSVAALALGLSCAWLGSVETAARKYSLDAPAQQYVDDGLKRALLTYGAARGLSAILSVAQGTEVALQPAGVGVKLSPGQALRPINDLVRQFADVMLLACVSFGAMKILLGIGSHWIASLMLSVAALAAATYWWRGRQAPSWLARLLLITVVIRFAVPFVSLGSEGIYTGFMADDYTQSQQMLKDRAGQIGAPTMLPDATADKSMVSRLPSWLWPWPKSTDESQATGGRSVLDTLKDLLPKGVDVGAVKDWLKGVDPAERVKELVRASEAASEHIVRLMVVFLLQTLVIPLVLGWAMIRAVGGLLQIRPRPVT